LTALSAFWLNYLKDECPNHLIDDFTDLRTILPEPARPFATQLTGRCMVVHKLKVLPIEAIVRGYITGSAWSEYVQHGTVHGIKVPTGMRESQPFKAPLFTPSTKAEQGDHGMSVCIA
jgi:phosphoribosylaminoimidazole-succinocarboxamide synthase